MNRFMVFAYNQYYPCGGWDDFYGSCADWDEADRDARRLIARDGDRYDYAQIVDTVTKEVWRYE